MSLLLNLNDSQTLVPHAAATKYLIFFIVLPFVKERGLGSVAD